MFLVSFGKFLEKLRKISELLRFTLKSSLIKL